MTIDQNADPDAKADVLRKLEALIPEHEPYYRHGVACFNVTHI